MHHSDSQLLLSYCIKIKTNGQHLSQLKKANGIIGLPQLSEEGLSDDFWVVGRGRWSLFGKLGSVVCECFTGWALTKDAIVSLP